MPSEGIDPPSDSDDGPEVSVSMWACVCGRTLCTRPRMYLDCCADAAERERRCQLTSPFISPWINWTTDTPIDRIIGEAVGAASMCWNPPPEGVFDPARANDIVDAVMDVLRRKLWTDA